MKKLDAIVIGAGFGGLRALLELRDLGLETTVLEAGDGVGGTWYWNRYPGARTDSEAWSYCYSFSRELWDEWDWPDRLPGQSDVLAYLDHVADRMDLYRDIVFGARVVRAEYREPEGAWRVDTDDGGRLSMPVSRQRRRHPVHPGPTCVRRPGCVRRGLVHDQPLAGRGR